MKSTLVLRNKSEKTGLSAIYVEYSYKGKPKRFPTGIKVKDIHWNGEKGTIKKSGSETHEADNNHIHSVKQNIDKIIKKYFEEKGAYPTLEYVTREYEELNDTQVEKTFIDHIDDYIELKKGKLSPSTIKGYNNLKDNIIEYQNLNKVKLNFDDINTMLFFEKYSNFLIDKGYYNNTISKRLSVLKTILVYYFNLGLNKSIGFKLYKFENKQQRNKEVVTLSVKELEALKALDLSQNKRLERVRDLFVLQCWTGLRYSDVVRLHKSHIKNIDDEIPTIKIDILKTNDFSVVPLFPEAKRILELYDYELKPISNDKYNEYLKQVCEKVKDLDKVVTFKHFSGKKPIVISKKKHQCISTHTARRSFITLMREINIPDDKIMLWSNHSDVRVFNAYNNAKQGEAEAAKKVIDGYNERVKEIA